MADPVTAVGLAVTTMSLVDYSIRIVKTCKALRNSAAGAIAENAEIEQAYRHLPELLEDFSGSIRKANNAGPLSRNDQSLIHTSMQCMNVATELQNLLNRLKVENPKNKFQLFVKALRTVSSHKLQEVQEKMEKFQVVLQTKILLDMRQGMKEDQDQRSAEYAEWRIGLQELAGTLDDQQTQFAILAKEMSELNARSEIDQRRQSLLQSLMFPEINSRREEIHEAHENTCQWIFKANFHDPEPDRNGQWRDTTKRQDFTTWLQTGSHVYFIQGKAGSGKSTLLNYICDDPRTKEALLCWAGDELVLTPTFFFWNSGTVMQKSIAGMLRSLIFQIINELPYLSTAISAASNELPNSVTAVWTEKKLRETLFSMIRDPRRVEKFCFFIDGLDEFDGEKLELTHLLKQIVDLEGVKACVSSRPWNVFQDVFKAAPQLRLENFNYHDISRFVKDKLDGVVIMNAATADTQDELQKIIRSLCDKAQGVFFWIHLAVASILRGCKNHDRISLLQKRLDALPLELEKMYDHMLQSVDPVYRDWTLALLYYSSRTPKNADFHGPMCSMLQLHFMLEPETDLEDMQSPIQKTVENWYVQDSAFVNAACLGLVRVQSSWMSNQFPVTWRNIEEWNTHDELGIPHQTVVSFVTGKLSQLSPSSRSLHYEDWNRELQIASLKSALWVAKSIDYGKLSKMNARSLVRHYIRASLESPSKSHYFDDDQTRAIIAKLDRLLTYIDPPSPGFYNIPTPSCLTIAVSFIHTAFARQQILAKQIPHRIHDVEAYTYLLYISIDRLVRDRSVNWSMEAPRTTEIFEFIIFLLESGANPNDRSFGGAILWERLLDWLFKPSYTHEGEFWFRSESQPSIFEMIRTFVKRGASQDVMIEREWEFTSYCPHRVDSLDSDRFTHRIKLKMGLSAWLICYWFFESCNWLTDLETLQGTRPSSAFRLYQGSFDFRIYESDEGTPGHRIAHEGEEKFSETDLQPLIERLSRDFSYPTWLLLIIRTVFRQRDALIKSILRQSQALKTWEALQPGLTECLQQALVDGPIEVDAETGPHALHNFELTKYGYLRIEPDTFSRMEA